MFAIIDTETSGGRYNEEKIIEIGILVYDGENQLITLPIFEFKFDSIPLLMLLKKMQSLLEMSFKKNI